MEAPKTKSELSILGTMLKTYSPLSLDTIVCLLCFVASIFIFIGFIISETLEQFSPLEQVKAMLYYMFSSWKQLKRIGIIIIQVLTKALSKLKFLRTRDALHTPCLGSHVYHARHSHPSPLARRCDLRNLFSM